MTDGELVRQARLGDRTASEALVRRWSLRVLGFCHARAGNRHAAEDLAQEALLRALRGLGTLETPDKFGSWLFGIAVRVCLDWRKARQTSQVPFSALGANSLADELTDESGSELAEAEDRAAEVRRLMDEVEALSEKHREVVMLYYYHDVTYRELAELLGVSAATINARLTQARTILRERLSCVRR
jgi:RNA polymerase sigma-70 factor (ECF subfamily)